MKQFLFLLVIATTLLTSCKKGEDDPFLSLRTRDARIRGEWILKEKTLTKSNGTEETFDGTTYTIKQDGIVTDQYSYRYTLTIEKGGTTKLYKKIDTQEYNSEDYWSWANTNKKKTVLIFSNGTYVVKRLTNKELVLERNVSSEYSGVVYDNYSINMKFEKK